MGLAFGLVIAAGACTCLGALLVFCASHTNTRLLSAALGASAGVMTVSIPTGVPSSFAARNRPAS